MLEDLVVLTTKSVRLIGPARTLSTGYNAPAVEIRVQNFQYSLRRRRIKFVRVGLLSVITDSELQRLGLFKPESEIPEPYHSRLVEKLLKNIYWHQAEPERLGNRFVLHY